MMPRGIGGHERVDVGFDQRARVELLVAQTLIEFHLFRLHLLARRIIGADQQVADDCALIVAQRRDGHDGRKAAAIFANVGQFVNVFDPARCLEHQSLKARGNGRFEFGAQRCRARDHFPRIGNVGRGDLVDNIGSRVAQHALGADIENLNYAFFVGGDAREVGAVENSILQGPGFEESLFLAHFRDNVYRARAVIVDGCHRVSVCHAIFHVYLTRVSMSAYACAMASDCSR